MEAEKSRGKGCGMREGGGRARAEGRGPRAESSLLRPMASTSPVLRRSGWVGAQEYEIYGLAITVLLLDVLIVSQVR